METRLIQAEEDFKFHRDVIDNLPIKIDTNSVILDFGCGAGFVVYQFRKRGFRAFGVDIVKEYELAQELCHKEKLIDSDEVIFYTVEMSNYKLPFPDNTFDLVLSNQVFEHVQNFTDALEEIKRVLKPGGSSLNFFPSKYRPIEGHIYVPFASMFSGYNYLAFWAFLGIRNEFQKGLNFREVAKINAEYLRNGTNYPSPAKVREYFTNTFGDVHYVENLFIENSPGRLRYIKPLAKIFPFVRLLVRYFHEQVIFVKKS